MRYGTKCGINWSCYYLVFEMRIVNVLSSVTCLPSRRQAGAQVINIQSTSHRSRFVLKCITRSNVL